MRKKTYTKIKAAVQVERARLVAEAVAADRNCIDDKVITEHGQYATAMQLFKKEFKDMTTVELRQWHDAVKILENELNAQFDCRIKEFDGDEDNFIKVLAYYKACIDLHWLIDTADRIEGYRPMSCLLPDEYEDEDYDSEYGEYFDNDNPRPC